MVYHLEMHSRKATIKAYNCKYGKIIISCVVGLCRDSVSLYLLSVFSFPSYLSLPCLYFSLFLSYFALYLFSVFLAIFHPFSAPNSSKLLFSACVSLWLLFRPTWITLCMTLASLYYFHQPASLPLRCSRSHAHNM